MKLLLIDDHALVREGLRLLLLRIAGETVVEEAATLQQAIHASQQQDFDLVLLDLTLADSRGLQTLEAFREAVTDVPVVILSGDQSPALIRATLDAGAVGYVPKSQSSEVLIAALRLVIGGHIYVPPQMLMASQADDAHAADQDAVQHAMNRLTERQREAARLLLLGLPNKVIARRMGVAEGTVKAHVSAILQVMGARSRVDAVLIAARHGIKVMG